LLALPEQREVREGSRSFFGVVDHRRLKCREFLFNDLALEQRDNTCLNGSRDFLQNLGPINTKPPGTQVTVTVDNEEIEEWSQLLY
jgi:hypothetical protein